ncbi:MAG: hypothetical protein AABX01_08060 [Candidatus Micrarchaeota archaeon]
MDLATGSNVNRCIWIFCEGERRSGPSACEGKGLRWNAQELEKENQ